MALSILDGTQTATTLSTILSSGQHITAHTVVSLGTQAITDMRSAVSGSVVSISNFPASQAISGTVTANAFVESAFALGEDIAAGMTEAGGIPISGTVTVGNTVTIAGTGTANIGAGTAQIGSVTASISGTVPISISSVTIGNSITIGSLPAITGTVTANVFGLLQVSQLPALIPVMNFSDPIGDSSIGNIVPIQITNQNGTVDGNNPLPIVGRSLQGTAVTTSNFTSTTASTVLANYNATREVLTIFNEGAGNLHIAPGATCTTIAYQVRLSSGDYYEAPSHQTTITHSAVFATAGTARVTEVS